MLYLSHSALPLQKPAVLIQPSLDLFLMVGETEEVRKSQYRLEAVTDAEDIQIHPVITVPLGLGNPYGLSLKQAEYVINRMTSDTDTYFVSKFYRHLCLDPDIRVWIDTEKNT